LGERVAANHRAQQDALRDLDTIVSWFRCVYLQTHAARLATASVSPHAHIPRHPLLYNPAFQTGRTLMARTLEAAGEIAAATVAEVVARMAEIVLLAVEAVATASAAETSGVERRLSQQMDADAAEVKERVESRTKRVVASTASASTPVIGHMDNNFNALEAELSRLREVLPRFIMVDVAETSRARQ